MIQIFDSHVHLNHPDFSGREAEAWQEANQAGVERATIIGYDLESSKRALEIAGSHANLFATVGVSPHDYTKAPDDYIEQLENLAQHPKVVAIGEAGLEYYYPAGPREFQIEHFQKQIDLANRLQKTIIVHLRDANDDLMKILQENPPLRMILHCFTGSLEVMQAAVKQGHYISLSGIVTFKNARDLQEIARQIPLNHLLIETDAPYLAPVPHRGKPCEPHMIADTARFLADLRGESFETLCEQTYLNASRAFGV